MRRFIFLLVGVGLLLGCPRGGVAVWIVEGSTADSLVFGLGVERHGLPPEHLDHLSVHPCPKENETWGREDDAIWWIDRGTPNLPTTRRLRCGRVLG